MTKLLHLKEIVKKIAILNMKADASIDTLLSLIIIFESNTINCEPFLFRVN